MPVLRTAGRRSSLAAFLAAALLSGSAAAAAPACPALVRLQPRNGWSHLNSNNCELCLFNEVRISRSGWLRWNGRPVEEATVRLYLQRSREMNPQPVTLIRVLPGADCATIGRISRLIERTTPCYGAHCPYGLAR